MSGDFANRGAEQARLTNRAAVRALLGACALVLAVGCGPQQQGITSMPTGSGCEAHLALGAPGAAHQVLCRQGFAVGYNYRTKVADWVAYYLTDTSVGINSGRTENFRADEEIPAPYRANLEDYRRSGFDRGHLAPRASVDFSHEAMEESFLLSNIAPQRPGFNREGWADLEQYVRACTTRVGEMYVVTGTLYDAQRSVIGNGVEVPDYFYKVLLAPRQGRAVAFLIPHRDFSKRDILKFVVSVDAIEAQTGIDFFAGLNDADEVRIEAQPAPPCRLPG